jgi:hypothetical protein
MKRRIMKFSGFLLAVIATCGCAKTPDPAYSLTDASRETGLSQETILAIALTESGRTSPSEGRYRPWPWTLNVNGQGEFFEDQKSAIRALQEAKRRGYRNIDVGAMQVNLRWNGDLVERPEHLLDPSINLWAFTQVIRDCQARVGIRLQDVVACYHAGPSNFRSPAGRAYYARVARHLQTRRLAQR